MLLRASLNLAEYGEISWTNQASESCVAVFFCFMGTINIDWPCVVLMEESLEDWEL